jgi:hypothetical protein
MVALRRVAAPLAAPTLGGMLLPVAAPIEVEACQPQIARTLASNQSSVPCDWQLWFNPDRDCLPPTASREGDPAPPLSTGNELTAASAAKRAKGPRGRRLP